MSVKVDNYRPCGPAIVRGFRIPGVREAVVSYPPSVTTVTVTGRWQANDPTAAAPTGSVTFTPNTTLQCGTDGRIVEPTPLRVALDSNGAISATLMATNDSDLQPSGWGYNVVENIGGYRREYSALFPGPGPYDLSTVAPATVTALTGYVALSAVGAPTGVATLDAAGDVPAAQLGNVYAAIQDSAFYGYNGWAFAPEAISAGGGIVPTSGQIRATRMLVPTTTPILGMVLNVITAATTPTNSFVALLDANGNRVAVSADISASVGSTGNKKLAFASSYTPPVAGGIYYAAFLFNGSPAPALARGSFGSSAIYNASIAAGPFRYNAGASGQTSIPGSITPSTFTTVNDPIWAGLYTA